MSDLVGEAYVKVHADTKYMANAIERDLRSAGKKGAESLLSDFDKTLRRTADSKLKGAQQALADAIVGGDFDSLLRKSGQEIDEFVDGITRDLNRFDRSSRVGFKGLDEALASLDQWAEDAKLRKAADEAAAAFDREWKAAERANVEIDRQVRLGEDLNRAYERADTGAWRSEIRKLAAEFDNMNRTFDEQHTLALRMNRDFDRVAREAARAGDTVDVVHRRFGRFRDITAGIDRDLNKFSVGGGIGRMFGKGSRNDFLNFLGSAIGGIVGVGEAVLKLPAKAVSLFAEGIGQLVEKFSALRAAGATIPQILGQGLAAVLRVGIPGLIALGAAVAGLSVVLPAIVSLISAALGGITAIAASLYFAIAGTLLPLVPVLGAIVAGIGPIIVGIVGLVKGIKDGSKATKELRDEWSDFMKATEGFVDDFTEVITRLGSQLLGRLTPAFGAMGDAVLNVLDYLGELFNAPGMDKFIDVWLNTMPGIFESVGRGVADLLAALTKFFAPILPYADRLATAFSNLMSRFNEWAGSARGQNSIADFMDKAWTAADRLWSILGNVLTALHNTFNVGQEAAGGSFLDFLDRITKKWADWTGSVEGQESLRTWFEHAREAGEKIFGEDGVVAKLFEFFSTLDTEQAAQDLQDFLDLMGQLASYADDVAYAITVVAEAVHAAGAIMGQQDPAASDFVIQWSSIPGIMTDIGWQIDGAIRAAWNGIFAFLTGIGWQIDGAIRGTWNGILTYLQGIADQVVGGVTTRLGTLPGNIARVLTSTPSALATPFLLGVAQAQGWVNRMPGVVQTALSSVPGLVARILSGIPGFLASPFTQGVSTVQSILAGGPGAIGAALSGWLSAAIRGVQGIYTALTAPFRDALAYVRGTLAAIAASASQIPGLGGLSALIPHAAGGIAYGPTAALIGEAGREAVVPLDRPLSMVDPAVRDLAAYARGQRTTGGGGNGPYIADGAIRVLVPNADPRNAAEAVLDRLVSVL